MAKDFINHWSTIFPHLTVPAYPVPQTHKYHRRNLDGTLAVLGKNYNSWITAFSCCKIMFSFTAFTPPKFSPVDTSEQLCLANNGTKWREQQNFQYPHYWCQEKQAQNGVHLSSMPTVTVQVVELWESYFQFLFYIRLVCHPLLSKHLWSTSLFKKTTTLSGQ